MKITEYEYREARDNYAGYCTSCDDVTSDSGVEPDACNYECPACDQKTVFGIEEALLMGQFELIEREHEEN